MNPSAAHARWAVREDAETEIELFNRELAVEADGTYSEITEFQTQILKEGGRNSLATHPLIYNSSGSRLTILRARSLHEGKEYILSSNQIEDKPLASSSGGFDQYHQVMLAYPHSEVGSRLYLKYQTDVKEPSVKGFFSTDLVFGREGYWIKGSRVIINSKVPLYLFVNDPEKVLKIDQKSPASGSGEPYHLEVTLTQDIFKQITDEPSGQFNPKNLPWVTVSSAQEWSVLAKKMAPHYEAVVQQDLPPMFEEIAKIAEKESTPTAKINRVTAKLAENIKYMGDWRSVSGKFIPHDLKQIADSRLGDCKDFSASTAAILRKLGMTATVAAVQRGEAVYPPLSDLPNMDVLNHVLVRVLLPSQNHSSSEKTDTPAETLWIDPTNFASYAQGIFPDISDRWALILDPKVTDKMARSRIPQPAPEASRWIIKKTIDLKTKGRTQIQGSLTLKGSSALWLTGAEQKASKESIQYGIIRYVGDENRMTQWKVLSPKLISRIADDLSFDFNFTEKGAELKTNAGPAMTLATGYILNSLLAKVNERVSDLYLGSPTEIHKNYSLKNIIPLQSKNAKPVHCSIKTPWVDADRQVKNLKNSVEILDDIRVKRSWIDNHEMKSQAYQKMQEDLDECFSGFAVVFSRPKG